MGGLLFLAVVAWNAYWVLSLPQRISVSETGQIEFCSPLRRRTARGKIRLLNQFDGFHDFLTELKARNPAVEIRGC